MILLDAQIVAAIKTELWNGQTHPELADKYGISMSLIQKIVSGYNWRQVPWPDGSTGEMSWDRRTEIHRYRFPKPRRRTAAERRRAAASIFNTELGMERELPKVKLSYEEQVRRDLQTLPNEKGRPLTPEEIEEAIPRFIQRKKETDARLEQRREEEAQAEAAELAERAENAKKRQEWRDKHPEETEKEDRARYRRNENIEIQRIIETMYDTDERIKPDVLALMPLRGFKGLRPRRQEDKPLVDMVRSIKVESNEIWELDLTYMQRKTKANKVLDVLKERMEKEAGE